MEESISKENGESEEISSSECRLNENETSYLQNDISKYPEQQPNQADVIAVTDAVVSEGNDEVTQGPIEENKMISDSEEISSIPLKQRSDDCKMESVALEDSTNAKVVELELVAEADSVCDISEVTADFAEQSLQLSEESGAEQYLTEPEENVTCPESDASVPDDGSLNAENTTPNRAKIKVVKSEFKILPLSPLANGGAPLENQLSIIHGEEISESVHNGSDDFSYVALTTEDIMKVYEAETPDEPKEDSILINTIMKLAGEKSDGPTVMEEEVAVMNSSQLLAILEDGSDTPPPTGPIMDELQKESFQRKMRRPVKNIDPDLEKRLALQQLKELPARKPQKKKSTKIVDVKIPKVEPIVRSPRRTKKDILETPPTDAEVAKKDVPIKTYSKKDISTNLSTIMDDWSDEEGKLDAPAVPTQLQLSSPPTEPVPTDHVQSPKVSDANSFVEPTPKRVPRVIKKKVIYDPDNPESYKFASSIIKRDTPNKQVTSTQNENKVTENRLPKVNATKNKSKNVISADVEQTEEVEGSPKSVTAVSPTNKKKLLNISIKKRKLTEVDKLLMDEGAVNMIYQLERSNNNSDVPELALKPNKKSLISISKEKRALVSKAKIIKKAVLSQSNDSNAKVFRVRKDKSAGNLDVSAQKVAGLRSSMQSPSLSEMSGAGIGGSESKIIRRHSSSSFSSGGLSPRPQSPLLDSSKLNLESSLDGSLQLNDSGIQNSTPLSATKIRKRKGLVANPNTYVNKKIKSVNNAQVAPKQKKVKATKRGEEGLGGPSPTTGIGRLSSFTQLTIDVSQNIAHITVKPTGNSEELYDLQVLLELTEAVRVSGSAGAVLLTSSEGALCGGLDLRGLLQSTLDQRRANADQLVDSFSELMVSLSECRAAVVCGVGAACVGPGVALLTLCDLALASDRATFCVAPRVRRSLPPEGAALLARPHALPPQVARELAMCGRKLTASEALQRGLVARTLWPDRFLEEVRSIAADLALHPSQSFGIIKSVMRHGEVASITAALRHESSRLVDFWCSVEGQDAIRSTHSHLSAPCVTPGDH